MRAVGCLACATSARTGSIPPSALADDRPEAALAGVTLTVEQVVTGGPDGDVTWHLAIADGRLR